MGGAYQFPKKAYLGGYDMEGGNILLGVISLYTHFLKNNNIAKLKDRTR